MLVIEAALVPLTDSSLEESSQVSASSLYLEIVMNWAALRIGWTSRAFSLYIQIYSDEEKVKLPHTTEKYLYLIALNQNLHLMTLLRKPR